MLDPDPIAHHHRGHTGVYAIPAPPLPLASDEPISSKNPSPNKPDPELPVEPTLQIPAQGRVDDVPLAVDHTLPPTPPVVLVGVDPPKSDDHVDRGNSGAMILPTSISATACAVAFLVHLYSYFSLNMRVLILVISDSIS